GGCRPPLYRRGRIGDGGRCAHTLAVRRGVAAVHAACRSPVSRGCPGSFRAMLGQAAFVHHRPRMSRFHRRADRYPGDDGMSIRSIILAAAIPLFILLAAVNGALLYYQSRAEMLHGLDQRALAAAVTTAEFLSEPAQPQAIVDDPQRHR